MEFKNLTIYVKTDIKYIFLITFFMWVMTSNLHGQCTGSLFLEIQDGFKNDTITISINDQEILKDNILSSDSILGIAYCVILISPHKENSFFISKFVKDQFFMPKLKKLNNIKSDQFDLTVRLNGKTSEFTIRQNKGSFIGIWKDVWNGNKIKFNQSLIPFEYE